MAEPKFHLPHDTIKGATKCGVLNLSPLRIKSEEELAAFTSNICGSCGYFLSPVDLNEKLANKICKAFAEASALHEDMPAAQKQIIKKVLNKELGPRKFHPTGYFVPPPVPLGGG